MRTTVTLDDELLAKARDYTGIKETSQLLRRALETLIHREAALRAISLAGTEPNVKRVPRRRYKIA